MTDEQRRDIVVYRMIFEKRSAGDYEDFITHDLKTAEMLYPETKQFVYRMKELVDSWLSK